MRIEDIMLSVRQMSTEQIEARLKEIRHSRTIVKDTSTKKRPTKSADKEAEDLVDLFGSLDQADIEKLMKKLGVL